MLLIFLLIKKGASSLKPFYEIISPISVQNEIEVLKYLQKLCQGYLSKYKSTYEEDLKIESRHFSGEKKLTFNHLNILYLRLSEKNILNFFLCLNFYKD